MITAFPLPDTTRKLKRVTNTKMINSARTALLFSSKMDMPWTIVSIIHAWFSKTTTACAIRLQRLQQIRGQHQCKKADMLRLDGNGR